MNVSFKLGLFLLLLVFMELTYQTTDLNMGLEISKCLNLSRILVVIFRIITRVNSF